MQKLCPAPRRIPSVLQNESGFQRVYRIFTLAAVSRIVYKNRLFLWSSAVIVSMVFTAEMVLRTRHYKMTRHTTFWYKNQNCFFFTRLPNFFDDHDKRRSAVKCRDKINFLRTIMYAEILRYLTTKSTCRLIGLIEIKLFRVKLANNKYFYAITSG